MAAEVRNFAVTIPAGTLVSAPATIALTMPPRIVLGVNVRVPPGPRGEVGWALAAAGVAVLPWNAGAWIVTDDESIDWPLSQQIDSGAWQLIAYNTGVFPHTLYVTFMLDLPQSAGGLFAGVLPISPASIAGVN